jgi:hypothetical protein
MKEGAWQYATKRPSAGEIFRYETKSSKLVLFETRVITDLHRIPELCLMFWNVRHAIHVRPSVET